MNAELQALKERRSVRKYKADMVPQELIDQVIEAGLYAASESTGGVHGAVRLGSCAVLDCLANGRIAGRNAAQEQNWS